MPANCNEHERRPAQRPTALQRHSVAGRDAAAADVEPLRLATNSRRTARAAVLVKPTKTSVASPAT